MTESGARGRGQHLDLPGWLWVLLLLVGMQLVSLNRGFWGSHGEARRAETAREVIQDGQWLTPTLLGEPFLTKPPLLYWSSATSIAVFGAKPWAARIPSLLATLGSWLAMVSLVRSVRREAGLSGTTEPGIADSAARALPALPLVLAMGLNAETEALLLCTTVCAIAATLALPPRTEPRAPYHRILPGLFLALGFLTKGPLGWLFPAFGILVFQWGLPPERRRLGWTDLGWILALQALVALPWFLLVLQQHPEVLDTWLGESVARLGNPAFTTHREPGWYYLPRLAVFLPALLWLGPSVYRNRVGRLLLIWLAAGVLFLSLATSKRTHYLLALAPAAALLVAVSQDRNRYTGIRDRLLGGLATGLPAGVILAGLWLVLQGTLRPTALDWITTAVAAAGTALAAWRPPRPVLDRWLLGLVLCLWGGAPLALGAVDSYRNPDSFYRACRVHLDPALPLLNWRNDGYGASFSLERPVRPVWTETALDSLAPAGALLLCTADEAARLPRPARVLHQDTRRDPFRATRTRTWQLLRIEGPVAGTGPSSPATGTGESPGNSQPELP